jgi:hypothetical protein
MQSVAVYNLGRAALTLIVGTNFRISRTLLLLSLVFDVAFEAPFSARTTCMPLAPSRIGLNAYDAHPSS